MQNHIYALTDSSKIPFYVGKSKDPEKRKKRHVYDALNLGCNLPVHNKIRKVLREQLALELVILETDLSDEQIDEREQHWIKSLREQGFKLYNVGIGGEGGKGLTPEIIQKIVNANTGRKRTTESKKKMSEARKGCKFSDEHKKNLSIARKKRVTSEETKQRMSVSSRGKINTKNYKLIDPDGMIHHTPNGLTDFCREHNLTSGNLFQVLNGTRSHHKGWRIENGNH